MKDEKKQSKLDAVVVGAGFSGLYMLLKLREAGLKTRLYEAGEGIGGTWYWNRYPGARCDVPSLQYSYAFDEDLQQEWNWPERYSAQGDILNYIQHVADRFDLMKDIQLSTRVKAAIYDDIDKKWLIDTEKEKVESRFCIMATGCLSSANLPTYTGLNDFKGRTFHTGNWPKTKVDFSGKIVGVIGTGSSAIQSIPEIAKEAGHLYVFQRTPNFSVPAENKIVDEALEKKIKANYEEFRKEWATKPFAYDLKVNEGKATSASKEELLVEYEKRWKDGGLMFLGAFSDLLLDKAANDTAANFIRGKIEKIVTDPKVAQMLMPDHFVGCKRLCADSGYYDTFNRDNVTLLDISSNSIDTFSEKGIYLSSGKHVMLEDVVLATGFDAMTGALDKINIVGKDKISLKEKWKEGPVSYLGLGISGFPNLFHVAGPGSPSVLTNMLVSIQQHVEWITDCISWMDKKGFSKIEASREAEVGWVTHVNEVADLTVYPLCNSWYLGANIPGKPRQFMPYVGGFPPYVEKCNDVANKDYEGFHLS